MSAPRLVTTTPPRLTAAAREERLDRAVATIKAQWTQATTAITTIGQVVLETCFDGDAHRALAGGTPSGEPYLELARRVDTLGIGLSRRMLSVAVRIAACDQLVRGNHWKLLDAGRKEDLLPLREPPLLAAGAKFAVEMGATRDNLQQWVAAQQEAAGRPKRLRGMTLSGTQAALTQLARLGNEKTLLRVGKGFEGASRTQQRKVMDQVREVRETLTALERRLQRIAATAR